MSKFSYLKNSILRRFSKNRCPSCGSEVAKVIDSKLFGLTNLLQCGECFMRYRFPADSADYNYQFYQDSYVQPGLTTDLPSKNELQELVLSNFANSEKDFSSYTGIFESIFQHFNRKIRILDYGANWGYSCYQFAKLEFVEKAYGYELSIPRRLFGEQNLGVQYIQDASELEGSIDVLFSSHVIEHMSDPSILKNYADMVLKNGGIILLTCPNGSDSGRVHNTHWSKLWGEVHPNFISDQYLCKLFSDYSGIVGGNSFVSSRKVLGFNFQHGMYSKLPTTGDLFMIAVKSFR